MDHAVCENVESESKEIYHEHTGTNWESQNVTICFLISTATQVMLNSTLPTWPPGLQYMF